MNKVFNGDLIKQKPEIVVLLSSINQSLPNYNDLHFHFTNFFFFESTFEIKFFEILKNIFKKFLITGTFSIYY